MKQSQDNFDKSLAKYLLILTKYHECMFLCDIAENHTTLLYHTFNSKNKMSVYNIANIEKILGGGFYNFDFENKTLELYGTSEEYGCPSIEDIKGYKDVIQLSTGVDDISFDSPNISNVLFFNVQKR